MVCKAWCFAQELILLVFVSLKPNAYAFNPPNHYSHPQSASLSTPIIELNDCKIHGKWDHYNLSVAVFNSIPYIIPPINNLRWKNPIMIQNYSDITAQNNGICNNNLFNATYHHTRCWQNFLNATSPQYPVQDENCVHLDIYSPSYNSTTSLPVFIFFHGGSSTSGGNFQYDFSNFSKEMNTVVVVPNYRLNLFGFLTFEALSTTSATKTSGNYGLFDLLTSLKWVKKYIHKFGGNPDDVTISGQSTGGTAVLVMTASSKAKGLFNRAISMSQSPNISMDLQTAEKQGERFVNAFGCNNINDEAVITCMQSIDALELSNSYPINWQIKDLAIFALPNSNKTGAHQEGLMIVDGDLMTESVFDALSHGNNPVPILIGDTQYESDIAPQNNVSNLTTESELTEYLNNHFQEWGSNFGENLWKTFYFEEWQLGGAAMVYDAISTDANVVCGNIYLWTFAADSNKYYENVYVFSNQQWPGNTFICNVSTDYECLYAFHGFDFMTATDTFQSFGYWGMAQDYEPNKSDIGFGQTMRNHWKHFMEYNEPMTSWKPYHKQSNYSIALLGSGVNKYVMYNLTNMSTHYKSNVCEFYMDNGIGSAFWWSN